MRKHASGWAKWPTNASIAKQVSRQTYAFNPRLFGRCLCCCRTIVTAPTHSCIKISGCLSTATAIACRLAMSGEDSR